MRIVVDLQACQSVLVARRVRSAVLQLVHALLARVGPHHLHLLLTDRAPQMIARFATSFPMSTRLPASRRCAVWERAP